jgi:hypothetical protein
VFGVNRDEHRTGRKVLALAYIFVCIALSCAYLLY